MTTPTKDILFTLIKSMSKSEKRQFTIYSNRLGGNINSKYLSLFNYLEKMSHYSDATIIKNKVVKKEQLSNLKAHLYKQILLSLRLNPINQNIRTQLHEHIDFATILQQRGLYKQAFKTLEKAKSIALNHEYIDLALEVVELQKSIENQYSGIRDTKQVDILIDESEKLSRQSRTLTKLSNLATQLYGIILKTNYVRSSAEAERIGSFFDAMMPKLNLETASFPEILWYLKAHLWHSFLVQDFPMAYKHAKKLVTLFREKPDMITLYSIFFVKVYNHLLEILFTLRYHTQLCSELSNFKKITREKTFPKGESIQTLSSLSEYSNTLNMYFLEGDFDKAIPMVPEILSFLKTYERYISNHQTMVLYYKLACLHFGLEDYKSCITFLKNIINDKKLSLREDLMCFSRILNLIAHYEEGLDYSLDRELRNTYKFLIRMNDLHHVQKEIIKFLKSLGDIYPQDMRKTFQKLLENLKVYENDPYEKRSFLYLDIISWLESKVENKPILKIIRHKAHRDTR